MTKLKPRKVLLRRELKKELDHASVRNGAAEMVKRVAKGNWQSKVSAVDHKQIDGKHVYELQATFQKQKKSAVEEKQWNKILVDLIRLGQGSRWQLNKWEVLNLDGIPVKLEGEGEKSLIDISGKGVDTKDYFDKVNLDPGTHFDHIYDRTDQIMLVRSALEIAAETELKKRFNCVLFGDPGCAKTEILLSTARMLGVEGEAWLKLDATSTSEAGAQKLLLDSPYIPPVLFVEEIEKAEEKMLRWLLGICDERGEIRKTNFRVGYRAKDVKMLVIATVNNMDLFEKLMSGALASRFPNKIYCPRPDRTVMQMILEREVKSINGNPAWIEPTIKFCFDEMCWNDPRKLIPVCLQGRDRLLDGTYQKAVRSTLPPKNYGKGQND